MTPTRSLRSSSSNNFSFSAVDLEEQLREMRRYEQEMKDQALARNIQRQEYQEPPAPGSPPASPILTAGPPMLIRQPATSRRRFSPVRIDVHVHQHSITGPIRQINRRSSRQITITHNPIGSTRQNASQRANQRRAREMPPVPTTTTSTVSTPHSSSQSTRRSPEQEMVIVSSDEDDSDDSVVSEDGHSNDSGSSDDSSSSSPSDSNSEPDGSFLSPVNQVTQPLLGNDAEVYTREFHPIDDNQPTTSRGFGNPPARLGTPDPTWGDCTMCFESPIEPRGCNGCHQIIGCKSCVDNWHGTAQHPSCPLCRRKWFRKPDVSAMTVIDSRLTLVRRRNQRYLHSLTVVAE